METTKIIRNGATLGLVALLTLCAEWTGEKEFIFPEIGALCIGLWVVNKHVWRVQKWQIPVLFTLSAVAGICIVRYLPCPLPLQMELGFLLVALLLMLFDASITPALSACLLPILIGTTSWLYVGVVIVSTVILVLGQIVMERFGIRVAPDEKLRFSVSPDKRQILLRWFLLMLILAPILWGAWIFDVKFVAVPPLIVTLVEFSNSASGFRTRPVSIWCTLVAAALLGSLGEGVLHQLWAVPQTISCLLAVIVLLCYFDRTGKYFAPAVAISLVPTLLPAEVIIWFPVYVAIGSAYFILMSKTVK